jgi:hypothetical protein
MHQFQSLYFMAECYKFLKEFDSAVATLTYLCEQQDVQEEEEIEEKRREMRKSNINGTRTHLNDDSLMGSASFLDGNNSNSLLGPNGEYLGSARELKHRLDAQKLLGECTEARADQARGDQEEAVMM